MTIDVIWHGSQAEGYDLINAIARNCTCVIDNDSGRRTTVCPAHDAFAHSQRWNDGLVFERRRLALSCPAAGQRVVRMEP